MLYPLSFHGNMSGLHPADVNCTHGTPWIWQTMHICVLTQRDGFAFACGIINIVAFLLFGIPQIVCNFRFGLPEGAISPHLLAFWTMGDILNFIGAVLVKELLLQIVVVIYGILMDFILVFQYLYYTTKAKRKRQEEMRDNLSLDSEEIPASSPTFRASVMAFLTLSAFTTMSSTPAIHFLPNMEAYIGYTLGWISAIMYLFSRVPQILQNHKRQTTEGLSIGIFICTIVGNLAYGLQIFLTSCEADFLLKSLPWIVGSLGVLFLDMIIFVQFFIYRKLSSPSQPIAESNLRTVCLSSSENTSQDTLTEKDSEPLLEQVRF